MWNRVVTIEDYWDDPRSGVAFRDGVLVAYKSLWDEDLHDYSDFYGVTPIDGKLLPLIEEMWAIWIRWSDAYDAGTTTCKTHPALPDDRTRYEELSAFLEPKTKVDEKNCIRLQAEFRRVQTGWNGTEVRWRSNKNN